MTEREKMIQLRENDLAEAIIEYELVRRGFNEIFKERVYSSSEIKFDYDTFCKDFKPYFNALEKAEGMVKYLKTELEKEMNGYYEKWDSNRGQ